MFLSDEPVLKRFVVQFAHKDMGCGWTNLGKSDSEQKTRKVLGSLD